MSKSIILCLVSLLLTVYVGCCYDASEGTCEGNKEKVGDDECLRKCMATCQEQCYYNNYGCTDDCLVVKVKCACFNTMVYMTYI